MLLRDIAHQAGVSPATVSRAINQPTLVAADSLARIRTVMREHNYEPAPLERRRGPKARLPAQRRIGMWFVGARANNPSLNWFQEQLLQVESPDPGHRVDLRVLFSATPDELPRNFAREQFDGLIVQGMEPTSACAAQLGGLPHVWFMTRRSAAYPGDYVEPNNAENGALAAEYLHEQGHKHVAVVATDTDYSAIVLRNRAFADRAAALGLAVHTILGRANPGVSYLEIASSGGESADLVRQLLKCSPKVTGLYLPSDHFCGAFFRALREAGRKPDRNFQAVLGNYNPIIYHNLDHSPAAIDINLPTLVRKVIDHLLWRIDNPGAPGRVGISISPTLVTPDLDALNRHSRSNAHQFV
ncbi:MAG TPA: LacI family DNA-binding transcriptional regulator [Opitutaceae bacterium]|nr:LacI family DNA-binding transcriptional regulator [Opitutaceae bacterium]